MARRRYTPKLKAQVVLEVLEGDKTPGQVAKAYGVHPNSVGLWKRRFIERAPEVFAEETTRVRAPHPGPATAGQEGGGDRAPKKFLGPERTRRTRTAWRRRCDALDVANAGDVRAEVRAPG